jgi:hypothetical protein
MIDPLLTAAEVAAILKVPKSWLYGRVHTGDLPFEYMKVGHYLRQTVTAGKKIQSGPNKEKQLNPIVGRSAD